MEDTLSQTKTKFELPKLPYAYDALEPNIDKKTMEIHHSKHHQGYVNKLNNALEDYSDYQGWELSKLLSEINSLPEKLQDPVRKHGGGHANHSLFWKILTPGGAKMSDKMQTQLESAFGSVEKFKEKFKDTATSRFGSGWAWLLWHNGRLIVENTLNQNSPIMEGKTPLLGIDVWEHAYYLKHQNRRGDWVDEFFKIVNWPQVEQNLEEAKK